MERTVVLGLFIAGIVPISLTSSTVVSIEREQSPIDLVQPATTSELNSVCSKSDLSSECLAKIPDVESELKTSLWLEKIANSWLFGIPFLSCDEQDEINSFSQSTQLANASTSFKTGNVLPSLSKPLSKLTNPNCAFPWQQQLGYRSVNLESMEYIRQTKLFSNHAKNSQNDDLSAKFPRKFPKLSRSSLIVSFPSENSSFVPRTSKLANPAPETERIASDFGWRTRPYSNQLQFHQGIDYGAPYGSPVVAIGSGIVTKVVSGCVDFGSLFCGGQLGNWIEVDHGNGAIGTYGHLKNSSIIVKEGMKVWKNQRIAQVGSSGWSTGAHLDFRLKVNGKHEDPAKYVTAVKQEQLKAIEK